MKTPPKPKTPPRKAALTPPHTLPAHGADESARLRRERAVLCARLARLLRRSLRGLDWAAMPAGDRGGLERALSALGGDIPLLWLIGGQAASGNNRPPQISRPRR